MSKDTDIDIARPLRFPIWLRVRIGAKQWSWKSQACLELALDHELKALRKDALKAAEEEWGFSRG